MNVLFPEVGDIDTLLEKATAIYGCQVTQQDISSDVLTHSAHVHRRSTEALVLFSNPYTNLVLLSWSKNAARLSRMVLLRSDVNQYVYMSTVGMHENKLNATCDSLRKVLAVPSPQKTDLPGLACVCPITPLKKERFRIFMAQGTTMLFSDSLWIYTTKKARFGYTFVFPSHWKYVPRYTIKRESSHAAVNVPDSHSLPLLHNSVLQQLSESDLNLYYALEIVPIEAVLKVYTDSGFKCDHLSFDIGGSLYTFYTLLDGETHVKRRVRSKAPSREARLAPSHGKKEKSRQMRPKEKEHACTDVSLDGSCVYTRVQYLARSSFTKWWRISITGFSMDKMHFPFGFQVTDSENIDCPAGIPVTFRKSTGCTTVNSVPIDPNWNINEIRATLLSVVERRTVEDGCCDPNRSRIDCSLYCGFIHSLPNIQHLHGLIVLVLIHTCVPISFDEIISVATGVLISFYDDNRTYEPADLPYILAAYNSEWKKKWSL